MSYYADDPEAVSLADGRSKGDEGDDDRDQDERASLHSTGDSYLNAFMTNNDSRKKLEKIQKSDDLDSVNVSIFKDFKGETSSKPLSKSKKNDKGKKKRARASSSSSSDGGGGSSDEEDAPPTHSELSEQQTPITIFFSMAAGKVGYSLTDIFSHVPPHSITNIFQLVTCVWSVPFSAIVETKQLCQKIGDNLYPGVDHSLETYIKTKDLSIIVPLSFLCGLLMRQAMKRNPTKNNLTGNDSMDITESHRSVIRQLGEAILEFHKYK